MSKKIVKKRKIKLFNFFIALLVMGGVVFACYCLLQIPTQNILIRNTIYLNDDDILSLGGVKDYPKFLTLNGSNVSKKLETSPFIHSAKIKKKSGFLLEIDVEENRPLFYNTTNDQFVFHTGDTAKVKEVTYSFRVPRLLNYVPDNKYDKFVEEMSNIRADILSKISDIEYQPNDYDKDRFLLYMDDSNMVYLTLTKFKMMNHYNEVLQQLENHKGILYLDNGNHFQIKE